MWHNPQRDQVGSSLHQRNSNATDRLSSLLLEFSAGFYRRSNSGFCCTAAFCPLWSLLHSSNRSKEHFLHRNGSSRTFNNCHMTGRTQSVLWHTKHENIYRYIDEKHILHYRGMKPIVSMRGTTNCTVQPPSTPGQQDKQQYLYIRTANLTLDAGMCINKIYIPK